MKSRHVAPLAIAFFASLPLGGCQTVENLFDFSDDPVVLEGERVPIMAANADLAADPQLANLMVTLPEPSPNAAWPQPGENAANTIRHLQAAGTLRPIWQATAGKGTDNYSILTASPIVANGVVYVLDAEGHLFAFNAENGARLWDRSLVPQAGTGANSADSGGFSFRSLIPSGFGATIRDYGGGLAFDGERLYATTGFRIILALNPQNGADIWAAQSMTPVHAAPVVADGRVYVITQENRLMVFNAANGELQWEHQGIVEPAGIATSKNVAVSGDTVIVPYSSGELYALRVDNGTPYWADQLTRTGNVTALTVLNDIAGRPVVDNDMVFAVSQSGTLVGINFRTGGRAWTRNIPGIQAPLPAGDFLFVVSTEGQVLCLTRADGRVKWVTQLPAFGDEESREDPIVWSGPLLVNGRLLLFSSDGRAVSLVPSTGQVANQIEIPDGTFIPPVMANGTLYVLTNEAQLVALR